MKNKKTIVAVAGICILGIIAGTFAYFSTTDLFHNIFNTDIYQIDIYEVFESPDNWRPGDTTPKTVSVTNTGDVDAAVRISYEEEWTGSDGYWFNGNYEFKDATIINFSDETADDWIKVKELSDYKDYYYYRVKLKKGESTSALINSVTFNPNVTSESKEQCTTDETTHKKTCTVSPKYFENSTYRLTFKIETVDYDRYKDAWHTNVNLYETNSNNLGEYVKSLKGTKYIISEDPDNNNRYYGLNPNNYVLFNDELWRMIGVFDGRVKLMRNESIGTYCWDESSDTGENGGRGINDWSQADLMYELNGDYINPDLQEDTQWKTYTSTNTFDHNKVLKQTALNMIDDAIWYLGSPTDSNNTGSRLNRYEMYSAERGDVLGKICSSSSDTCNDTYERHATWTGKVGLIYPSDFVYSSSGDSNHQCGWVSDWSSNQICSNTSWMVQMNHDPFAFTISPAAQTSSSYYLIAYNSNIAVFIGALNSYPIYPSVYLKSDVIYTGGNGTHDNPFVLSI